MNDETNAELLALVRTLTSRIDHLEAEVKSLRVLHTTEVPEEVMIAIAAAVAAYLGHRAKKRQAQFGRSSAWTSATRRSQLNHAPIHLR